MRPLPCGAQTAAEGGRSDEASLVHGGRTHGGSGESNEPKRGKMDLVSVLYVAGGIPAIVGFLVLLFAIGVRYCGLPA